ncbi:anthrone oxygenase family protein [Streptomyces sp. 7N604]|uniref:anthrone oxygenase family protein n=1 Tax=Streptomyces sp. 7N604 TaxID=3457415 RepID=UPI003FD43B73
MSGTTGTRPQLALETVMELTRNAALLAATITMGLMAGLFYAFAISVMPGLGRTDDRTFVDAMQKMNAAILNGWFAIGFAGALVLTALAVALHIPGDGRAPLPWAVAALVLYGAVLVITFAINVPLNNELEAAGDVHRSADVAAVRERFEATWVRWNIVRAVLNTGALGCLAWALVLRGRA